MQTIEAEELAEVARLIEVTSDAVALCASDGTILHVNAQLLALVSEERDRVVGQDVKDLLFSTAFERSLGHGLPFTVDNVENTLMLKLADGSFVPVVARALPLERSERAVDADHALHSGYVASEGAGSVHGGTASSAASGVSTGPGKGAVVAIRSLEEQYAHDRQSQRLLSELQAANRRLSGTLSVIMSTVGSDDMPTLLDTVLNRMADTLDAAGTTIYFSESGGFKLRGVSRRLEDAFVPAFIPYGAGIPTYVLREQRACRLSIVPAGDASVGPTGGFYDLDARTTHPLRMQDTPPFKTLIAVPVFFGTQVLGIIELGWTRPCTPRVYDVRVLEVICDYLSIELVGLVSSLRAARTAEFARSLNKTRELFFTFGDDRAAAWRELTTEIRHMLSCHLCPVVRDVERGCWTIDFEGGSKVDLPGDIEELFFSTTTPAARVGAAQQTDFMHSDPDLSDASGSLKSVRLARVDRATRVGAWLERHGLPCQGVFVDMGADAPSVLPSPEDGVAGNAAAGANSGARAVAGVPWDAGTDGANSGGDVGTVGAAGSAYDRPMPPQRTFLLLRDGTQEPIDDIEFDYLTHLARDFELITGGAHRQESEHRIAQTLQAGMRSSLGMVPGITSDSLYSSATSQALVGGDFYTLLRLPDDFAVMILGDVSGKGVEAASMSALVKTALTAYAWEGAGPARMARSLNSMLMSFSRVETFVTAFIAKIDLRSGSAVYCSAGHPPTMLLHPEADGTGEVELLSVQSGVLGAFDEMVFEDGTFEFSEGDILFMYTDGAIEARDTQGAFFGEQRLRDVLLRALPMGVHGLCGHVLDSLDEFANSALDDDIALVALRFDSLCDEVDDGGAGVKTGGKGAGRAR